MERKWYEATKIRRVEEKSIGSDWGRNFQEIMRRTSLIKKISRKEENFRLVISGKLVSEEREVWGVHCFFKKERKI